MIASPTAESTTTAAPTTEATAAPAATATATPGVTPERKRATHKRSRNADQADGCLDSSSSSKNDTSSTSTSGCDSKKLRGDHRVEAGPAPKKVAPFRPAPSPARTAPPPRATRATRSRPPGPRAIGVPNFFIDKFRIPPFLLPIYQAAGIQYGIRWEVLAAINEIETDYGRNLNVSSAGALGWMQFMPATWETYGVDANGDGLKDPFNPVDAIFAAARYLRAAGADKDLRRAIFAYNHADWYVDSVLMRARVIGGLPADLVGSLTGLTQGRFPVRAKATYAGALTKARPQGRAGPRTPPYVVESDDTRRDIEIFAAGRRARDRRQRRPGHASSATASASAATSSSRTSTATPTPTRTSSKVAETYPAPKKRTSSKAQIRASSSCPSDREARSAPRQRHQARPAPRAPAAAAPGQQRRDDAAGRPRRCPTAVPAKERLFAHPTRPNARAAGGDATSSQAAGSSTPSSPTRRSASTPRLRRQAARQGRPRHRRHRARPHRHARRAEAPRTCGSRSARPAAAPRASTRSRSSTAGSCSSRPRSTAPRASNPFFGADAETPSIGQIMLMSKEALARHVLADPRIDIYGCGRHDIRTGQIDRRVLATLEFLAASRPQADGHARCSCGHGYLTAVRQRLRAHHRHRGRHRRDQRHPDPPATRARARSPT